MAENIRLTRPLVRSVSLLDQCVYVCQREAVLLSRSALLRWSGRVAHGPVGSVMFLSLLHPSHTHTLSLSVLSLFISPSLVRVGARPTQGQRVQKDITVRDINVCVCVRLF